MSKSNTFPPTVESCQASKRQGSIPNAQNSQLIVGGANTHRNSELEYMFLNNYSTSRLSYFLCKSLLIPMVVQLCWQSWLPIMATSALVHQHDRYSVLCGIGFGLIFTQILYQVFSKGLVYKFDILNKHFSRRRHSSIASGEEILEYESPINF